jgi:hypothetical protein
VCADIDIVPFSDDCDDVSVGLCGLLQLLPPPSLLLLLVLLLALIPSLPIFLFLIRRLNNGGRFGFGSLLPPLDVAGLLDGMFLLGVVDELLLLLLLEISEEDGASSPVPVFVGDSGDMGDIGNRSETDDD